MSSMINEMRSENNELSIIISNKLNNMMLTAAKDFAKSAITECGIRYGFDGTEAIRELGLDIVTIRSKTTKKIKPSPKQDLAGNRGTAT
jgi:hypothetical protein